MQFQLFDEDNFVLSSTHTSDETLGIIVAIVSRLLDQTCRITKFP
jgi:hypothetical protein